MAEVGGGRQGTIRRKSKELGDKTEEGRRWNRGRGGEKLKEEESDVHGNVREMRQEKREGEKGTAILLSEYYISCIR